MKRVLSRRGRRVAAAAAFVAAFAADHSPAADLDYRARYGHAAMSISCTEAARPLFEEALTILHSFDWATAREKFKQTAAIDPDCAMAYWGVAMSYYDSLHEPPSADEVEHAAAALKSARLATRKSGREAAYVDAAAALFDDTGRTTRIDRDRRYSKAMAAIAATWPDDDEAKVLYALSLLALARRGDAETSPLDAAAILEPLFAALPEHPGVAHYLIHAYDDAGEREPGVAAARRYAGIAPAMTHAQHMPSHIFAGLGLWEDSNASNAAALKADAGYYHALMYLVYGELQLGRWPQAKERIRPLTAIVESTGGDRDQRRGLHSAMTWLILETRDWHAAAEFPAWSDAALDVAETLYVRGLGAARIGRRADAEASLHGLKSLSRQLEARNDPDLLVRARLARIQSAQIEGLLALADGNAGEAVAILERAATLEDEPGLNRAPPDSGTGLPAHEVLGEVLFGLDRFGDAARHFEASLARTPNRLHSLVGLARSAAAAGDRDAADSHYRRIADLLAGAEPDFAYRVEARRFIGND